MANQQAGLQGNQQNIGAYNAMGNMAQGLGALGNSQWGQQMDMFGNLVKLGNASMFLGQGLWDKQWRGNKNVAAGSQMPTTGLQGAST